MMNQNRFILPELSKRHQSVYLGYAQQVLEAQQQMTTSKGKNILHYTLKKKRRHESMSHYPKGDRIDHSTGSQYFYHCHREDYDTTEHGHFHCFMRYKHIPKRVKPLPVADWDKYIDNPMTHLVAISMNQTGMPIRLFTVNRWVTSEIWYEAQHVSYFLKKFKMTLDDDPYWLVLDRWVEGMLHLFAPQIAWLHQERDRRIELYKSQINPDNVFMDFDLEETSELKINLNNQIQWILSGSEELVHE